MLIVFQAVETTDDTFWDQFWCESSANISDVFTLIPASEIRSLRDENPSNLATLCYKVGEKYNKIPLRLSVVWHKFLDINFVFTSEQSCCVVA